MALYLLHQAVRRSLRPEDAQVLEGLVSSVLSQPPDGHLLDQLVSPAPPTAEAREAQQVSGALGGVD